MKTVAALFVCKSSPYWLFPGVDCWDISRDARNFHGSEPVVAHPRCRAWGKLRCMAKPREDEKDLAFFALSQVRKNGGVMEHPARSSFFTLLGLRPGVCDHQGGYILPVLQYWFGHRADKATWLYVCGVSVSSIPPLPYRIGYMERSVEMMGKPERERTPSMFANWLVDLARGVA